MSIGFVFVCDLNNGGNGMNDALSVSVTSSTGTVMLMDKTTGSRGTFASWIGKVYCVKNLKSGDVIRVNRGYGEYSAVVSL